MDEGMSTEDFDSGVIVTCEDDKYIGYLLGSDDIYLYMKYTHKAQEVWPKATEASIEGAAALLAKRPLWVLRAQVARKFRVNSLGYSREHAAWMLAEDLVNEIIDKVGPTETFVAQSQAIKIALPHSDIICFESLTDVTSSAILSGLDFTASVAYNEDHE